MVSGKSSHTMFSLGFMVIVLLASQKFEVCNSQLLQELNDVSKFMYNTLSKNASFINHPVLEKFIRCSSKNEDCTESSLFTSHISGLWDQRCNTTQCRTLNKCSSSSEILKLFDDTSHGTKLSFVDFERVLPFIVLQAEYCRAPVQIQEATSRKPSSTEVWLYSILFVTLISICSLVGVSVLPFMAKNFYQRILSALIGLAVGSLASSALFHLIPQAFNISGEKGHDYLFVSLTILGGLWAFFLIETAIKYFSSVYDRKKHTGLSNSVSVQGFVDGRYSPSQSFDNLGSLNYNAKTGSELSDKSSSQKPIEVHLPKSSVPTPVHDPQLIFQSQQQVIKASFPTEKKSETTHTHEVRFTQGKDSVVSTVAYMIIFGDGFHNFIDGISIGAAFQQSILTGISISMAVMCEELPHELGDFAVLLNSGMTIKQALFYNFLSATTCYVGMVIGIILGEFTEGSSYIFASAGGMFLYIGLVDMFPEMNATFQRASKEGSGEALKVFILQNIGIFIGVFSLFFLAYYQDSLILE